MKNKKSFVAGLLASVLMLSGCDAFFDANNYANKMDFDANNRAFKVRKVGGNIEYEVIDNKLEVYFVPIVEYVAGKDKPVAIAKENQSRVSLKDDKVIQIAHDGSVVFEEMSFSGFDVLTLAQLANFDEIGGKLYYQTLQSEAAGGNNPVPRYYYEQKEVILEVSESSISKGNFAAVALEVYDFDQERYDLYANKGNNIYKGITENGLYASVIFNYVKTEGGTKEEIIPFKTEIREDTIASVAKAEIYRDPETGDELVDKDKKPLIDVIVNIDGTDISLRYNQPFFDNQNSITEMIENAKSEEQDVIDIVNSLITYRYFDIMDEDHNIVVANPSISNFKIVENEEVEIGYEIHYEISTSKSYLIDLENLVIEHIIDFPGSEAPADEENFNLAINPVIAQAGAYLGNDEFLTTGEYAGIHLVGSLIVK